jgi:hypothetical protein
MKLSPQLIFDSLPDEFESKLSGVSPMEATLEAPELLAADAQKLQDGRIIVTSVSRLPRLAKVVPGCALLCIGDSRRLDWFRKHCAVITVRSDLDFYTVFSAVQQAFLRIGKWVLDLYQILESDGSIQSMLEASSAVTPAAAIVVDSSFTCVASTGMGAVSAGTLGAASAGIAEGVNRRLPISDVYQYLASYNLSMSVKEPFTLEFGELQSLNANLIDSNGYHGCLSFLYPNHDMRPGDCLIVSHLAHMVLRGMSLVSNGTETGRDVLKRALSCLIDNLPLGTLELAALQAASSNGTYVCVLMRPQKRARELPLSYICNSLEEDIPGTVAFEYRQTSVAAFIRINNLAPEGNRRNELEHKLLPILASLDMKTGMSDHVSDPLEARSHFLQASIALDKGSCLQEKPLLYRFQDFALAELLENCTGEMPVEMYFTGGLRRLLAHDRESTTSYMQTLSVFLKHNMNVTHTAKALYIHRSTLIDRLERMKTLLSADLEDPDERLRIELVLRALELRDQLKTQLGG